MMAAERLVLACVKLCEPNRQEDILQQRRTRATRRDLGKILDAISSVRRIRVLGGEPELESPVTPRAVTPPVQNLPIAASVDSSEDDGDS